MTHSRQYRKEKLSKKFDQKRYRLRAFIIIMLGLLSSKDIENINGVSDIKSVETNTFPFL